MGFVNNIISGIGLGIRLAIAIDRIEEELEGIKKVLLERKP